MQNFAAEKHSIPVSIVPIHCRTSIIQTELDTNNADHFIRTTLLASTNIVRTIAISILDVKKIKYSAN